MASTQRAVHPDPAWGHAVDAAVYVYLEDLEAFEILPARHREADRYEICSIPFFAYDINLGDCVSARLEDVDGSGDRVPRFERVIDDAGRYTFRVEVPESDAVLRDEVLRRVRAADGHAEWSSPDFCAVDQPDRDRAAALGQWLTEQEQARRLVFDTGRSVDPSDV